jgi:hypothetical protein
MPIIAALANNIVFFIIILLCWCPPFAAQLEDCFAGQAVVVDADQPILVPG